MLCCSYTSVLQLQVCVAATGHTTHCNTGLHIWARYHTSRDHFTDQACHTRRIYIHHFTAHNFTAHHFTAHHHTLQRCVACMDESCHTYGWVRLYAYIWMSHVTHLTTLLRTVARCNTVLHILMSHESYHAYEYRALFLFFTELRVLLIE